MTTQQNDDVHNILKCKVLQVPWEAIFCCLHRSKLGIDPQHGKLIHFPPVSQIRNAVCCRMAQVVHVESREHIERLVTDSDKLVVRCFTGKEKGGGDTDARRQHDDEAAAAVAAELAGSFDSVALCIVDLSMHPDVATSVLMAPGGGEGVGEGEAWGGEDAMSLASRWMFFNAGKLVSPGGTCIGTTGQ